MRTLTAADVEAAVTGGSVLAAGGGGWVDHGYLVGDVATRFGEPRLAAIDEIPDDGIIVTVTAIGSPAAPHWQMVPADYVRALQLLIDALGQPVAGLITAQNGSSTTLNGWTQSAVLGIPVVDAAGNGRAQPTGKFGSMGLLTRRDYQTIQTAAGGNRAMGAYLEVTVRGSVARADDMLRAASLQSGGFIAAARNPVPASYAKQHAAVGAISYALRLGEAMVAARSDGPEAVVEAVAGATRGRVLGRGAVRNATVDTRDSFDFAQFVVDDAEGPLTLHVMNEYMAVDRGGVRLATFPDLICTLGLDTGLPVSVAQMREGREVAVLVNDKADLPCGTGVRQPDAYLEVEKAMGIELRSYALADAGRGPRQRSGDKRP
ncbi:MAG: DUF917 domain-containing protein [Chloroflexota bacterium]